MKNLNRILVILLIFFTIGCRTDNPEMVEKIEAAEARWEEQNIPNYDLFIQRQRGLEDAQFLTMTVNEGQISDVTQECGAPPGQGLCAIEEANPEEYTVEGLFELARNNNHRANVLSFDEDTGVMTFMSLDDETVVRVQFTPQE